MTYTTVFKKTSLCLRLAQHCPLEAGAIVMASSPELLVLKVQFAGSDSQEHGAQA